MNKNEVKKIHKLKCYNHVTRKMTQAYHQAKNRNNKLKTKESMIDLKIKSKAYRKSFNKAAKKSRKELVKKLRSLKSKNAKAYWQMLQNSEKKNVPILIHELYNHFKQISQDDDDENNEFNFEEMIGIQLDTSVLNCLFTNDEIKKCIIRLKNGKSGGADDILNEHIKSTIDIMMPVYIKLFNKVLSTVEVPEDWLVGLILKEIQAGFRKGYSTMDQIFVLKHIIDLFI